MVNRANDIDIASCYWLPRQREISSIVTTIYFFLAGQDTIIVVQQGLISYAGSALQRTTKDC